MKVAIVGRASKELGQWWPNMQVIMPVGFLKELTVEIRGRHLAKSFDPGG